MEQHETIAQHREQHLEQRVKIDVEGSASRQRQIPQNDNFHGTRRLNLTRLNANNAILILQLTSALSS
jgi:hypothetical protein